MNVVLNLEKIYFWIMIVLLVFCILDAILFYFIPKFKHFYKTLCRLYFVMTFGMIIMACVSSCSALYLILSGGYLRRAIIQFIWTIVEIYIWALPFFVYVVNLDDDERFQKKLSTKVDQEKDTDI